MKTKIILEEHVKLPESNETILENDICTVKCNQVKQAESIKFFFFLKNFTYLFTYLFLAVLGLRFCARAFL